MVRLIKTDKAESEALYVFADIKKFSYFAIKKQIIGFDLDPNNGQVLFDVAKVSAEAEKNIAPAGNHLAKRRRPEDEEVDEEHRAKMRRIHEWRVHRIEVYIY
ncbi:uncharacterized protein EHS24_008043 [Apiotrichum porosum]|uniref:Uncharacterized protein n=1 Tax=Apiotrichum porosum TaxID=105984 RepID=A0A427XSS2_9TREE|nr:uncharacterized protein EHS24_008043 [Apiotrichum porosum]RSH81848.1 hypothetical protein EHS24_008043 [Apiotrichum porosum]